MNYLFLFLLCMPWTVHAQNHRYFSKRQKAIITNYLLHNVENKKNTAQKITTDFDLQIAYYQTTLQTAQSKITESTFEQSQITPAAIPELIPVEHIITPVIEQPRIKTIHDIIKFFKGQYPRPEDNTLFFEIVTQYFNTHWEYTFYATWKKNPDSYRETEILTKALIYLAQAYGKETQYTFYTGYEPYSIAYLLENVCYLDTSSIIQLP